jgi:hypothetical protein
MLIQCKEFLKGMGVPERVRRKPDFSRKDGRGLSIYR